MIISKNQKMSSEKKQQAKKRLNKMKENQKKMKKTSLRLTPQEIKIIKKIRLEHYNMMTPYMRESIRRVEVMEVNE